MRGKVLPVLTNLLSVRITPACAGKSFGKSATLSVAEDHPRVCGEKLASHTSEVVFLGSPPRVRGKGAFDAIKTGSSGITPACAGKSFPPSFTWGRIGDHPRVCGEKRIIFVVEIHREGSPPRVRGKDIIPHFETICSGITPACAGKRAAIIAI